MTATQTQQQQAELRGINDIHSCAMLVDLRIKQWTARRKDKRVTQKVAHDNNVDESVGAYHKSLVDGSLLEPVKKIVNSARTYHYTMTLPWFDKGARALSSAAYFDYKQRIEDYREQYENAVKDVLKNYPYARQEAKRMLGNLFDEQEYPTVDRLAEKFGFAVDIFPLPKGNDFRCELGIDEVSAIRRNIEEQTGSMLNRAVSDVYQRVYKILDSYIDRLDGDEKKVFRDTLVENARELVSLLPALNITDDPKIEDVRSRIESRLCQYDADTLRQNATARERTCREAKALKSDLNDFLGGAL